MENIKFSHIGIIIENIQEFGQILENLFQNKASSDIVEDPKQKAFLQMYRSGRTFIELIAPSSEDSPVHTALKRQGEGLAHLCFETDNLAQALRRSHEQFFLVRMLSETEELYHKTLSVPK